MARLQSGTRIYGTATVDTILYVNGTATSTSSGGAAAISVVGGVNVAKDLYVGGTLFAAGGVLGGIITGTNTTSSFTISNTSQSTSTTTGALVVAGGVGVGGNIVVGGTTVMQQSQEVFQTISGAVNTVNHDYSTGGTFIHTNLAGNFTANVLNLPAYSNRSSVLCLILQQGSVPYICNGIFINSIQYPIYWAGGAVPGGTANKVEAMVFTIFNTGSYTILGQLGSYG